MKPHCDVAEGPAWHSPRSGLVQLCMQQMEASHLVHLQSVALRWLAPTADADRSV